MATKTDTYAIISLGGKQYRVAPDDIITIDKLGGSPGELIEFGEVLVLGGDNVQLGAPTVAGASVAGEVVEQGRGPKIIAFKKRRRKNSRRRRGHRQEFTVVRITEILTDGKRPSPRQKCLTRPRKLRPRSRLPKPRPRSRRPCLPRVVPGRRRNASRARSVTST